MRLRVDEVDGGPASVDALRARSTAAGVSVAADDLGFAVTDPDGYSWRITHVADPAGPAGTPAPPYTAVIFTSVRRDDDHAGYAATAAEMEALAAKQPGYLGIESARGDLGLTVSYWASARDARAWKQVAEHRLAQRLGREHWYRHYRVRVATVEREYGG